MKRNNKIEKNILNHPFLTISTLFLNYLLRRSAEEVQKKCSDSNNKHKKKLKIGNREFNQFLLQ